MNLRTPTLTFFLIILFASIFAQTPFSIAIDDIKLSEKYSDNDLSDIIITDQHKSKHNGLTHIYLRQRFNGIEIKRANINYHILENGLIASSGGRFFKNLHQIISSNAPTTSQAQALERALSELGIEYDVFPTIIESQGGLDQKVIFDQGDIALENIKTRLIYFPVDEKLKLSWELSIYEKNANNYWIIVLDAQTNEVLQKYNRVLHCNFDKGFRYATSPSKERHLSIISIKQNASVVENSYRVFAFPIESPNHGGRTLEISPWDQAGDGGTLGWHDDGTTVSNHTKGNNVDAYNDLDNSNSPTGGNNARVDGGSNHEFDFPLDLDVSPWNQPDPIITNLFYWTNIMHDVMYQYGFHEECGNFQENNLARGGAGGDYVYAEGQDDYYGPGNYANFLTQVDGINPRMQLSFWDFPPDYLVINEPQNVAGSYPMLQADFGGSIDMPVTADVKEVNDGTVPLTDGCQTIQNDITGKIALLDRGTCEYGTKCLNAQNAGAIAVIVCNNQSTEIFRMSPGMDGDQVTIPVVMVGLEDCNTIRAEISNGLNATMLDTVPIFVPLDSGLDNGIIAHEYGHGISERLTGGDSTLCLNNEEQMGEGWSDFFALWMTTNSGDNHDDSRGMGTYVLAQEVDGNGIRPTPYSTDFLINNSTYGDIHDVNISMPHGIGYLWCTMIWDLNWALINAHGYDADIYNSIGSAGNLIAMQLVIDGLMLQGCDPGFQVGRNAILEADTANNGGANGDIIWNVFARRGMGYSADQGDSNDRFDGSEAFDLPPGVSFMTIEELFELPPLPVELLTFNAIADNKEMQIKLYWATASETNNKGFEIQRRRENMSDFKTIGWINGSEESFSTREYNYIDEDINTNIQYYYRLNQIDFNGASFHSKVVTASLRDLNSEFEVYPNPTSNIAFVKLSEAFSGEFNIKIYNVKGQQIDSKHFVSTGSTELEVNFTHQPEGVYFIEVEVQNKTFTKRILVRR